jgi:hypothetical protein
LGIEARLCCTGQRLGLPAPAQRQRTLARHRPHPGQRWRCWIELRRDGRQRRFDDRQAFLGSTRGTRRVRWSVAGGIVWAWILTIPCSAFIAAAAWWLGTQFL